MENAAIKTIQENYKASVKVNEKEFVQQSFVEVKKDSIFGDHGTEVYTLLGMVEYLKYSKKFNVPFENYYFEVKGNDRVSLFVLHESKVVKICMSHASIAEVCFDILENFEDMIIQLMTCFDIEKGEAKKLISLLSSVSVDDSINYEDNGINQNVTVKKSNLKTNEKIENPISLVPYLTYREIDLPMKQFIFRIKDHRAKLTPIENGEYESLARTGIKEHLLELLEAAGIKDVPVLI